MKKVLHIINLFSSASNFIGGQFKFLTDSGYEMHLICSPDPEILEYSKEQGFKYKEIVLERQLSPKNDLKALIEIIKYIKKNKIDTVICHQAKGCLLGAIGAKIAGVKNILILEHGALYETASGLFRKALIAECRFVCYLATRVICVSPYILELGITNKTSRPEKRCLLGSGSCGGIDTINMFNPDLIDTNNIDLLKEKYDISPDDFIIGFAGRLVRDKGIIELLEGFNIINSRFPGKTIKLMIIGQPEKWDGLPEETLNQLQSNKDIIYTGQVPRNEMPNLYSCMDILILPSYREGLPTCNLEAQSMRIPVVTTAVSGSRDSIVNEKTGLYCQLTGESIAVQVEKLFDEDLRKRMGEEGRRWVSKNFDHTKVWPHMKALLDSISNS